ncbi:MAG: carboxypeptidase-like regulatory domain-containing protein [Rhodospirillaceae bacterium]|nr:carboxypeptidase-like regulatory domain-containing protein [Rhodospirillaceae bacterium]
MFRIATTIVLAVLGGGLDAPAGAQRGKVNGTVLNAVSEAPVAGAQVDYEEDGRVQTTRTDSKGYFEFGAGTLGIVTVRAEGFGTAYMRWPPRYGASLRILLREPRSASGTVIDMATRNPIGGATVTVMALSVNRNIISDTAMSKRGGEFGFEDLPAGRDQVEYIAYAQGFAPRFGLFTLNEKGSTNVGIGLLLDALASGTVFDAAGDPIQGALVNATYSDQTKGAGMLEGLIGGRVQTGADGTFQLDGIAPDEAVTLQAEFEGRVSNAVTVTVAPGTTQTGITLRVQ